MKNIKKLIVLTFLVLVSFNAQAQEKSNKEKIEALKAAFITEKLELTEQESKVFWPLYEDYQKDRKMLRVNNNVKDGRNSKPNFEEMTDAEVNNFIDRKLKLEEETALLKRSYFNKIKEVLPIKKVAKLIQVEKEFRHEVLKRLKEKR